MSNIFILIGCYFALLALLSAVAKPHRQRLAAIAASLRSSNMSKEERQFVDGMLASAYSWRSAIMLFLIYLIGMFQSGPALDRECDKVEADWPAIANDTRIHGMLDAYFVSVAAVNPIFGALAFTTKRMFQLKARLHHSAKNAEKITDFRGLSLPV